MFAFSNGDCYSIRGLCQKGHHFIYYLKFLNVCTPLESDITPMSSIFNTIAVLLLSSLIPKYITVVVFQWHLQVAHRAYTFYKGYTCGLLHVFSLVASWYAFSYSGALDTGRETNILTKLSQRSFL